MIYFKQMELGPMGNFVYLVGDPDARQAAVVDAAWDVARIFKTATADGFTITDLLVTHAHPDHVNGVAELCARTGARVHVHSAEIAWLGDLRSAIVPSQDGTELNIGQTTMSFLHTPGHSPGSQCFRVADRLITGDTLFIGACGRTDLPGGNPKQLFESLARLKGLDDSLLLCPGHDYGDRREATLGQEKTANPFLRAKALADFLRFFQAPIY